MCDSKTPHLVVGNEYYIKTMHQEQFGFEKSWKRVKITPLFTDAANKYKPCLTYCYADDRKSFHTARGCDFISVQDFENLKTSLTPQSENEKTAWQELVQKLGEFGINIHQYPGTNEVDLFSLDETHVTMTGSEFKELIRVLETGQLRF